MPFCKERKILFLHLPKTAGTSIENALNIRSKENLYDSRGKLPSEFVTRQHLKLSEYKKYLNLDEYFKFTVVREPFDRFVSAFHFKNKNMYVPQKVKNMNFDEFVFFLKDLDEIERCFIFDSHFEPQYTFIDYKIDTIFKFEKLDELEKRFKVTLGKDNVSDRKDKESYYNSETKEIVYNLYKKDFEMFSYET